MHAWCDVLASVLVSMLMPLRVKASLSNQMNKVFCISNQTAISTVNPTTRLCSFFPSPFSHRSTCGPFRLMANQLKWQSTFANSNKTPFVRIEFVIKKIPIYHHVQLYITHTHTQTETPWSEIATECWICCCCCYFISILFVVVRLSTCQQRETQSNNTSVYHISDDSIRNMNTNNLQVFHSCVSTCPSAHISTALNFQTRK